MARRRRQYPLDENEEQNQESEPENKEQDQDKIKLDQNMSEEEANQFYNKQSTNAPPRDINIPIIPISEDQPSTSGSAVGGGIPGLPSTVTDSISDTSDMTDMQYAAYRLFPPKLGSPVKNANMVGRVDPNIYLARLHLNSIDEIMRSDPLVNIDVNEIWNKNEILLSIGLDGMGRIDLLELAGAAREEKRLEKSFSSLGGGL